MQEGVPKDPPLEVMYVGSLPVDIGVDEQEVGAGHENLIWAITAAAATMPHGMVSWSAWPMPVAHWHGHTPCTQSSKCLTTAVCTCHCLQRIAIELKRLYNCCPVYIDKDIKEKYYKGVWAHNGCMILLACDRAHSQQHAHIAQHCADRVWHGPNANDMCPDDSQQQGFSKTSHSGL